MFLKILSFDIEVLPLRNQMPVADKCPIMLFSIDTNYKIKTNNCEYDKISLVLINKDKFLGKNFIIDENKIYNIIEKDIEISNGVGKVTAKILDDYGLDNNEIIIIYDNEVEMINMFFKLVKTCDICTGFNINGFDWVYVLDRCKFLEIRNIKIGLGNSTLYHRKHLSKGMAVVKVGGFTGKIIFDVLYLLRREDESNPFKKKYNLKRLKLEDVSRNILGIEKLDFSVEEMINYWENYTDSLMMKMLRYGRRDSEIPLKLIRQFRLLDKFVTLSKRSGKLIQEIINSMGSGLMVENLIMKDNILEGRVTPCRLHLESKEEEELRGADVFEPILGVHENVGSVDYRSLYPSLMMRENLCFTTLVVDDIDKLKSEDKVTIQEFEDGTPYGIFIKKDVHVGTIPKILERLLSERMTVKKEMKKFDKNSIEYMMLDATQNAIKILLNSFFGYSGDSSARTYSWIVASAVTTNGRKQIQKTKVMIEKEYGALIEYNGRKFGCVGVQGDTDSVYIKVVMIYGDVNTINVNNSTNITREEVVYCVGKIVDDINKVIEKPMHLEFENYIKRIIIVAKKRYAMLVGSDDGKESITTKGLEVVRRDWCDMATENMRAIIDLVLLEKDIKVGVNKSVEHVRDEARKLKRGEISSTKLILTNKLTKPITSYDNKEQHVLVAIKMKERGKSSEVGDRIEFIITDNGKELISERAEEAQYVIDNKIKIDYDYYINKQLIPPALRVLGLLGINRDVIVVGIDEKQKLLSKWF